MAALVRRRTLQARLPAAGTGQRQQSLQTLRASSQQHAVQTRFVSELSLHHEPLLRFRVALLWALHSGRNCLPRSVAALTHSKDRTRCAWGCFAQDGDRTVTVGRNYGAREHREADSQMPCTETIIGNDLGKLESLRGLQNVRAAGSISHEERRRRLTCLAGRHLTNIV